MLTSNDPQAVNKALQAVSGNPALQNAMTRVDTILQNIAGSTAARDTGPREGRSSGGKVGTRDYPAKAQSRMEKALKRAPKGISRRNKTINGYA
jgi:hypothetical protein